MRVDGIYVQKLTLAKIGGQPLRERLFEGKLLSVRYHLPTPQAAATRVPRA